jgi:hypothetical protein
VLATLIKVLCPITPSSPSTTNSSSPSPTSLHPDYFSVENFPAKLRGVKVQWNAAYAIGNFFNNINVRTVFLSPTEQSPSSSTPSPSQTSSSSSSSHFPPSQSLSQPPSSSSPSSPSLLLVCGCIFSVCKVLISSDNFKVRINLSSALGNIWEAIHQQDIIGNKDKR